MELVITAYSHIDPSQVIKNHNVLFDNKASEDFNNYTKSIYQKLDLSYSKFYKMDELCKLAFLAAEVLLSDTEMSSDQEGADIAIIIGNRSSSVVSDQKHFEAISDQENYFPSPAVFVYTLPNIMLGELCIRYNITGENNCFLMEQFDTTFFYKYVKDLFEKEDYKYCITGWVDHDGKNYSTSLFLIENVTSNNHYISKFKPNFDKIITK